jgi:hypothetical protein
MGGCGLQAKKIAQEEIREATMFDIDAIMKQLAVRRPIFHSEADLQHELAWEIHMALPDAQIRVERPPSYVSGVQHVDLWAEDGDKIVLFELKCKPRELPTPVTIVGETFNPRSGAGGRLGFVKDLARLETLVDTLAREQKQVSAYAILLTSKPHYWKASKKRIAAFVDVCEGKILYGPTGSVALTGSYDVKWQDYSQVTDGKFGQFRYLAIKVEPG